MTSPRALRSVFTSHVRGGQARGRDGVLPGALEPQIAATCTRLSSSLRDGSHRFTQYRQMLISKGAGKPPRVISIPTARDRIALKALAIMLVEVFPGCEGAIPQRRVEEVRRYLDGRTRTREAYVRVDIREFYPSISHEIVQQKLAERVRKREIRSVLLAAVSTPTVADGSPRTAGSESRGVPQGLAISNLLAEIVAQSVDKRFRDDPRFGYFRFVDDILLLCDAADARVAYEEVVAALKDIGLTAHPIGTDASKSQIGLIANGFDYLGYVFKDDGITVRSSSIRRVESALARAYTRYARSMATVGVDPEAAARALVKCKWDVDLIISGCVYKGAPRGWIEYFRQMDDLTLLKRLDATVSRFARRFGLPNDFLPKSFMRAYWILRHPRGDSSRYIPNFDDFSLDKMRWYLGDIAGRPGVDRMTDGAVSDEFFRLIGREVAALEMDVGTIS